ncbi:MAG: hypothetical protein KGI89_16380 [Euryarchaeota archaeon]|nr:hypothetical protein [Euryarchaeota archaeon]
MGNFWGPVAYKSGPTVYTFGGEDLFMDGGTNHYQCGFSHADGLANVLKDWRCPFTADFTNPAGAAQMGFWPLYPGGSSYPADLGLFFDNKGVFVTTATEYFATVVMTLTCQNPSGTVITCPTDLVPSSGTQAGQALVWDPADGYDLLYDTAGYAWQVTLTSASAVTAKQVATTVAPPGALFGASIAYDAACGYVVMFGGSNSATISGTSLNSNTWKYHAGTFTQLYPVSSPTARAYAGMDYDYADGELFIDGGTIWSGSAVGTTTAYTLSASVGGCP